MKSIEYKPFNEKFELVIIHHEESVDKNGKVIPPCDEVIKKVISNTRGKNKSNKKSIYD